MTRRELLEHVWGARPGLLGWLGQCNHKAIGRRFIFTAFFFLLLGGVLALLMRTQLAVPENDFVGPQRFNELFTMHGTIMMFLFVVPMMEGFTIYVAPLQLGARDMPMPRLNVFGYFTYLFGGIFLLSSAFVGEVPDSGWFAYVPLTLTRFNPGMGLDFWLLGVTMLEVSGIVAAIEVVVLVARFRAAGLAISRIPVFVWAALVKSVMILFAFPPLVAGTVLLELDRKLGTVFYDPTAGGDPLLWQHLFWWFGHPEVYIQLIPGLGMAASIVTAGAGRRMSGRTAVIASLVAIGILSFGLWVHHMYATGIPLLATSLFTAASFMIAIPSGVIVMAFIGTLWWGRIRWSTSMLYIAGFVFVFVAGGITGVMIAMVPFDWQSHDTYFIVAHFHYVLVGGSLFPILGAFYHWMPKLTGRLLNERAGKLAFILNFVGFNVAFFPQHALGLFGMPRRVWTYEEGVGLGTYNLVSTVGSYVMGLGMLVFTASLITAHLRGGVRAPNDPWGGESLEWATASPAPDHNFLGTIKVATPEPMWDGISALADEHGDEPTGLDGAVDDRAVGEETWDSREGHDQAGIDWQRRLDEPTHGLREVLSTTLLDAEPDHIAVIPGHSLWPFASAVMLAGVMFGILIDSIGMMVVGVSGLVATITIWLWPGVE